MFSLAFKSLIGAGATPFDDELAVEPRDGVDETISRRAFILK